MGGASTELTPVSVTRVTGFALGGQQIYIASPQGSDPGTIYGMAVSPTADAGAAVPIAIAKGQPTPTSLALDAVVDAKLKARAPSPLPLSALG